MYCVGGTFGFGRGATVVLWGLFWICSTVGRCKKNKFVGIIQGSCKSEAGRQQRRDLGIV